MNFELQAPTEDTWNGRLVTYVVQCLEKSSSRHLIQRSVAAVSSDQLIDSLSNIRRQAILEPLKPATSYSISIRSLNRVGSGPESETVIVNTPEAGVYRVRKFPFKELAHVCSQSNHLIKRINENHFKVFAFNLSLVTVLRATEASSH